MRQTPRTLRSAKVIIVIMLLTLLSIDAATAPVEEAVARLHRFWSLQLENDLWESGFMLRLGTHLRDDIGPPAIRPGFLGCTHYCTVSRSNWYFFVGAEGLAMARNIFRSREFKVQDNFTRFRAINLTLYLD